jgi:DNA-binding HxlR family transcriptional regulator
METIASAPEPGIYSGVCPARDLLDRIADKWTALIIGTLSTRSEPVRFGELRRAVQGISQKMLTQTLRELERDGLVVRTIYAEIPPRVEYALTPLGRTLDEPLGALSVWVERSMAQVRKAQETFDGRVSRAST